MENQDRIKALNILFSASAASIFISVILSLILLVISKYTKPDMNSTLIIAILSPVITYIIGRIMCFKEYKDETP